MSVYKKLLEFYKVAFDILTSKGVRLVINLMWETLQSRRLPEIVQAFVRHASTLDKLISKATNEIALDIKDILIQKQSEIILRATSGIRAYVI